MDVIDNFCNMQNVLDDVICLVIIKSNSRYAVIPEF